MKNSSIIGIVVGIIVVVLALGIVLTFDQESDIPEVEDVFDKEIRPIEVPEIQDKLDEVKKIADENE